MSISNSINKFDNSDMLSLLLDFPNQCRIAKEIGVRFKPPKKSVKPNLILWCGMGGSAIGGDLTASYIQKKLKIPMIVNRHYNIPSFVNKNSLVVASSYSGNTEETMSCYKQAKAKETPTLVLTSGDELQEMAIKDGAMLIAIPQDLPPRCALGYLSIPVIIAFAKMGLIKLEVSEIDEAIDVLQKLRRQLEPNANIKKNISLRLAKSLYNKFPLIYGSVDCFGTVAYRWKTQIAENAKMLSSYHLFAELNHNEIEGFEPFSKVSKNVVVIILKDKSDHPRIKKRIQITTNIIRNKGIKVLEVNSIGKSALTRMLSVIYIGDWTSFYMAILNKVDPTPVNRISYLKKRLVV